MSKTNIRQWILMASTAVGFGALGWGLGQASRVSGPPPAVAHDDTPPPHTLFATGPLVAVAKDGRVTLHVDHESLSWVLAEIDRQAGAPVTAMDAAPKAAARGPAVAQQPPASEPAARPDDVLARVLRGTEPERYDALVQSLNGGAVSVDTLKTLYQTDASPRVRLLAFEDAQEATEGDPAARRLELEAARLLPDAVVAEAAARRLEALDRQAREAAPQDAAQR
jgi:hypothetical protein